MSPSNDAGGDAPVRWPRLYIAVLVTLVIEIGLFYLLTRTFL
jgi:hypothetical protein